MNEEERILIEIQGDIRYLKERFDEQKNTLETKYVTKDEFAPVKAVSYGIVTAILLAVIGAIMTLVLSSGVQ